MSDSIPNLKYKSILSTIYSSGLRISEATNLRISDIIRSEMKIRIRNGKGNKDRYSLLSEKKSTLIKIILEEIWTQNYSTEDYLFVGYRNKPISKRSIELVMKKATTHIGITKKDIRHSLRHSFTTHLMNDGVDLVTIQALLGHSNLKSASIYLHVKDYSIFNIKSPLDKRN